jgi:hypothetical protein
LHFVLVRGLWLHSFEMHSVLVAEVFQTDSLLLSSSEV